MEDDRQPQQREEFELDLNINLYLTLNYVKASEHLKYSARKLYNVFVAFVGLNNNTIVYAQYRIWIDLYTPSPIRQKMPVSKRYRYWISDRRTPN